jgi:hypothetical protein
MDYRHAGGKAEVDVEDVAWRLQVVNELDLLRRTMDELAAEVRAQRRTERAFYQSHIERLRERLVLRRESAEVTMMAVAVAFGASIKAINAGARDAHIVDARHAMIVALVEFNCLSLGEVAERMKLEYSAITSAMRGWGDRCRVRRNCGERWGQVRRILEEEISRADQIPAAEPPGQRKEAMTENNGALPNKTANGAASEIKDTMCAFDAAGGRATSERLKAKV